MLMLLFYIFEDRNKPNFIYIFSLYNALQLDRLALPTTFTTSQPKKKKSKVLANANVPMEVLTQPIEPREAGRKPAKPYLPNIDIEYIMWIRQQIQASKRTCESRTSTKP